jgi:hypothetical protein
LRLRPAAVSATEDDINVVGVVVVVKVVERFGFGDRREQSSSDRICL